MSIIQPFSHPIYVMLKPVGSRCNLACQYCYYLEKGMLHNSTGSYGMSDDMLENFIRQYLDAQTMQEVLFIWHGGEPLLKPMAFYEKALQLQKRYAKGRTIDNCIQTNGTLITEEWCSFFHDNNFLVGISIDGPRHFHNQYRGNTFDKVMHGIELLNKYDVQWNAMAVVNNLNVEYPLEFYRFFRNELNCRYLQFTPVVERTDNRGCLLDGTSEGGELTPESVTAEDWGLFLCNIFDEWVRCDVGTMFVQLFDATLANWYGMPPGICSLAPTCGHSAAMEHNGDLYSCDHFVFPEYRLGNIKNDTVTSMMYGERQRKFGQAKHDTLTPQCRQCEWLFACNGECPKNRFAKDADGNPGHNYLCQGYKQFFNHAATAMDFMTKELQEGRAPRNVMQIF